MEGLILASASPRRHEMLRNLGLSFEVVCSTVDEEEISDLAANEIAPTLALAKANEVSAKYPIHLVLAADTVVLVDNVDGADGQQQSLGKPTDEIEAFKMLQKLSGRTHQVITAFALVRQTPCLSVVRSVRSEVAFRDLSKEEIEAYVKTGEPFDKAGGYGIQGKGAIFISTIVGSYTNVVGLPLTEVISELRKIGHWDPKSLHQ